MILRTGQGDVHVCEQPFCENTYYDTPVIVGKVIIIGVRVRAFARLEQLAIRQGVDHAEKQATGLERLLQRGLFSSFVPSTSTLRQRARSIHDSKYLGLPAGARRAGTWIVHNRQTVCKRPPGLLFFGSLTLGWPCTMLDAWCHRKHAMSYLPILLPD